MVTSSVTNHQKEICPEVELLNQACLDLVAQIEQLKKENTLLKKMKEKEGEGKWVRKEIKG
jgi:hypothetical protein